MSVKFVCDGCGAEAVARTSESGDPVKPASWYARSDKDGRQDACSRECIYKVAKMSGKTDAILPLWVLPL